ncbi:hypothetical protein SAMN05216317_103154 [Nitrosomonas eutropha]|nr:hypothetical protein SAMN05216379_102107 [Nitrosomonas eutropha]SDW25446.1 hypothetical protein SAMN05216317_103154 [Nitrosomonas eutropha]SEI75704.1 hypothetical protein SAMN05216318_11040 [Nitrosomonas eutropha]
MIGTAKRLLGMKMKHASYFITIKINAQAHLCLPVRRAIQEIWLPLHFDLSLAPFQYQPNQATTTASVSSGTPLNSNEAQACGDGA